MNICLFISDTLADWEIGYLTAEVCSRRFFAADVGPCNLVRVGNGLDEVTTLGGMRIRPDVSVADMECGERDILVLPGGYSWSGHANDAVLDIAVGRIKQGFPVAAICGATIALACRGALNERRHTSNDLSYLKTVAPDYRGESLYENRSAVRDGALITASGQGAVTFTAEILGLMGLFKPEMVEAWRSLYLTNEAKFFYEMMRLMNEAKG